MSVTVDSDVLLVQTGQMGEPVDGNRGTNDALNSKGKHECKVGDIIGAWVMWQR